MEQYISKSAVVAEIKRIMAEEMSLFKECCKDGLDNTCSVVVYTRMKMLLSFINTLEVKEVDLEKEYKDFVEEDLVYNKLVNGIVGKAIAKHFFELGLKIKGE